MNFATQINRDVEQIKIFNITYIHMYVFKYIYANNEKQAAAPSNYESIEVDLKLPIAMAMNGQIKRPEKCATYFVLIKI